MRYRTGTVNRILLAAMLLAGNTQAMADPLDRGEAYTTRQTPPEWMDSVDFGLLLVDYGVFALTLIGLGWLLLKKPHLLYRLETVVRAPFSAIFAAAKDAGGVLEYVLQLFGIVSIFVALGVAVFFCQWLNHIGLGALSMIGLAFVALLLVRMIKGSEQEMPVP
ncbi:MAG: hypothetical protein R8J85_03050 [Mariprofundales bacterium]